MADDRSIFIPTSVNKIVREIFDRKGVSDETQTAFFEEVNKYLSDGVEKGFGKTLIDLDFDDVDYSLLANLKYNAGVFATFKNHAFQAEIFKLLIDEDGEIRDWKSFKEQALKIDSKYNQTYLKAEYDMAVGQANMAAKWQKFRNKVHLYPNVKYHAVMDERTRELHALFNGIILPIDHPFWKIIFPPLDWGCRCDFTQTDEPVNRTQDQLDKLMQLKAFKALPKQFSFNAGVVSEIYPADHPYYDTKQAKAIKKQAESNIIEMQFKDLSKSLKTDEVFKLGSKALNVTISDTVLKETKGNKKTLYLVRSLLYDLENVLKNAKFVSKKTIKGKVTSKYTVPGYFKKITITVVNVDGLSSVTEIK